MQLRMICKDKSLIDGPGYLSSGESYRVGRSSSCSFVVSDLSVSRFHAEVIVTEAAVLLKDLRSRNGTFVDEVRIEEVEVQVGQRVRFGGAQFHLVGEGQDVEVADDLSGVSTHIVQMKPGAQPASVKLLSPTQRKVFDLLLTGLQEKEVASKLEIARHTVHNHVRAVYRKLGVSSRSELLALFIGEGQAQG